MGTNVLSSGHIKSSLSSLSVAFKLTIWHFFNLAPTTGHFGCAHWEMSFFAGYCVSLICIQGSSTWQEVQHIKCLVLLWTEQKVLRAGIVVQRRGWLWAVTAFCICAGSNLTAPFAMQLPGDTAGKGMEDCNTQALATHMGDTNGVPAS